MQNVSSSIIKLLSGTSGELDWGNERKELALQSSDKVPNENEKGILTASRKLPNKNLNKWTVILLLYCSINS